MSTTRAWYIRRLSDNEIRGPFPVGQISQEVLLGRHKLDDEVSQDKEEWVKLGEVEDMLPTILAEDSDDPVIQDRLAAARRWADERRGIQLKTGKNQRDENGEIKRRQDTSGFCKSENNRFTNCIQVGLVFSVIVAIIFLAFQYSPEEKQVINCSATVTQQTVFDGCDLKAVNLATKNLSQASFMNAHFYKADFTAANLVKTNFKYAQLHSANMQQTNLSQANLKGATLVEANLSNANLSDADLSYADLRKANIINANFSNTNLSNTIWVDGSICKKGSIGICK